MRPHEAGGDSPRQRHSKCLLPVANENLAGPKAKEEVRNPKMQGSHVDAQSHILGQPFLKLSDNASRMYRIPGVLVGFLNPESTL